MPYREPGVPASCQHDWCSVTTDRNGYIHGYLHNDPGVSLWGGPGWLCSRCGAHPTALQHIWLSLKERALLLTGRHESMRPHSIRSPTRSPQLTLTQLDELRRRIGRHLFREDR